MKWNQTRQRIINRINNLPFQTIKIKEIDQWNFLIRSPMANKIPVIKISLISLRRAAISSLTIFSSSNNSQCNNRRVGHPIRMEILINNLLKMIKIIIKVMIASILN
jgi:hypothetical protein